MMHEVIRPFPGPGSVMLQAGEEVDTSTWLHTDRLVANRYLRPVRKKKAVEPPAVSAAKESKKGLTGKARTRKLV